MRILEARGRGLVEQRHDVKTRRDKGIERQKALGARGVGRHADRGLDRFTGRKLGVRALAELVSQLR